MRIAMFTPGYYPVAKDTIKATEFFIYGLASGLIDSGHEIILFGAIGSDSRFELITPKYDLDKLKDKLNLHEFDQYLTANFCDFMDYCNSHPIDILHDHSTTLSYPLARFSKPPVVSTFHGVRGKSVLGEYYAGNRNIRNVAPSQFVAASSQDIEFSKVIYHGVDTDEFSFSADRGAHFLNIGRIIPEKGQLDAIKASELSGLPLKLAGYKPEYISADDYYNQVMEQVNKNDQVEFIGKVERLDVPAEMKKAKALLMPIKYEEAFGLVMIEAMACGTPVIAYKAAAAAEIIEDGVTGFLVERDRPDLMAEAMKKIDQIDRKNCRKHVENKFSLQRMVGEYEQFYGEVLSGRS